MYFNKNIYIYIIKFCNKRNIKTQFNKNQKFNKLDIKKNEKRLYINDNIHLNLLIVNGRLEDT